jgi:mercuric resistance transcriptional repressor protein MerD
MLTVSQLARQGGVAAHVVRFYVRIGLIRPSRRHDNGYRLFDKSAVARLGFIRAAKHLGFTLNEIRQITARADSGSSPCADVRAFMRERIAHNRARLDAMLIQQARMEAALAVWEEMPDRVPDGDSVCHLIESFALEEVPQSQSSTCTTTGKPGDKAAAEVAIQDRVARPRGRHQGRRKPHGG